MFYNYLIFNMVTLSLRILLKYCVSFCKNKSFCRFEEISKVVFTTTLMLFTTTLLREHILYLQVDYFC